MYLEMFETLGEGTGSLFIHLEAMGLLCDDNARNKRDGPLG